MNATYQLNGRLNRWFLVSLAVSFVGLGGLLAACSGTETATTAEAGATTEAVTTSEAASTSSTGYRETQFFNIPYMTRPEGSVPALLDVYAPEQPGPWPVVVMLHEGGDDKMGIAPWARKVAQRGAVVFVPEWMRAVDDLFHTVLVESSADEVRALIAGQLGDVAAAVRFARATAARYGGDPENLTLFGPGVGAMQAVVEAFSGVSASEGALQGAGSTLPESLVIFEPDYLLLSDPLWDTVLARDPGVMALQTPWAHLGHRVDFPITVIGSGDLTLFREIGDPWAEDSWLAVRDPSGDIRRGLEEIGAFVGGCVTCEDMERAFVERLKADGDTVTYLRLTGSTHFSVTPEDFERILDALVPKT